MKKIILLVSFVLIGFSSWSQDMLGSKLTEVRKTTKNLRGVKSALSGDSIIKVSNRQLERNFQFKFDADSKICYQENIQLDVTDLRNKIIVEKFLHSKKLESVDINSKESLFVTSSKIVCIRKSGNIVSIFFTLKKLKPGNDQADVASLNDETKGFALNADGNDFAVLLSSR